MARRTTMEILELLGCVIEVVAGIEEVSTALHGAWRLAVRVAGRLLG